MYTDLNKDLLIHRKITAVITLEVEQCNTVVLPTLYLLSSVFIKDPVTLEVAGGFAGILMVCLSGKAKLTKCSLVNPLATLQRGQIFLLCPTSGPTAGSPTCYCSSRPLKPDPSSSCTNHRGRPAAGRQAVGSTWLCCSLLL